MNLSRHLPEGTGRCQHRVTLLQPIAWVFVLAKSVIKQHIIAMYCCLFIPDLAAACCTETATTPSLVLKYTLIKLFTVGGCERVSFMEGRTIAGVSLYINTVCTAVEEELLLNGDQIMPNWKQNLNGF